MMRYWYIYSITTSQKVQKVLEEFSTNYFLFCIEIAKGLLPDTGQFRRIHGLIEIFSRNPAQFQADSLRVKPSFAAVLAMVQALS